MFEMNVEKLNILNPKWIYTNSETDFPLNYIKKNWNEMFVQNAVKKTTVY